jgi:hypothetical protein
MRPLVNHKKVVFFKDKLINFILLQVRKNEIFKESEHEAGKTDYDTTRTFRYPGES